MISITKLLSVLSLVLVETTSISRTTIDNDGTSFNNDEVVTPQFVAPSIKRSDRALMDSYDHKTKAPKARKGSRTGRKRGGGGGLGLGGDFKFQRVAPKKKVAPAIPAKKEPQFLVEIITPGASVGARANETEAGQLLDVLASSDRSGCFDWDSTCYGQSVLKFLGDFFLDPSTGEKTPFLFLELYGFADSQWRFACPVGFFAFVSLDEDDTFCFCDSDDTICELGVIGEGSNALTVGLINGTTVCPNGETSGVNAGITIECEFSPF